MLDIIDDLLVLANIIVTTIEWVLVVTKETAIPKGLSASMRFCGEEIVTYGNPS